MEKVLGLVRWYKAYCRYYHDDGSGPFEGNWYDNERRADAERCRHDAAHHSGASYARPDWKDLTEGSRP